MSEKTKEMDTETHFKDTFRVFSKDEEGLLIYNNLSSQWQVPIHWNYEPKEFVKSLVSAFCEREVLLVWKKKILLQSEKIAICVAIQDTTQ